MVLICLENINDVYFVLTCIYIDAIRNRLNPVYQGLRATAGLTPQVENEDAFVGIYAANSAETILTEIGNVFLLNSLECILLICRDNGSLS